MTGNFNDERQPHRPLSQQRNNKTDDDTSSDTSTGKIRTQKGRNMSLDQVWQNVATSNVHFQLWTNESILGMLSLNVMLQRFGDFSSLDYRNIWEKWSKKQLEGFCPQVDIHWRLTRQQTGMCGCLFKMVMTLATQERHEFGIQLVLLGISTFS